MFSLSCIVVCLHNFFLINIEQHFLVKTINCFLMYYYVSLMNIAIFTVKGMYTTNYKLVLALSIVFNIKKKYHFNDHFFLNYVLLLLNNKTDSLLQKRRRYCYFILNIFVLILRVFYNRKVAHFYMT